MWDTPHPEAHRDQHWSVYARSSTLRGGACGMRYVCHVEGMEWNWTQTASEPVWKQDNTASYPRHFISCCHSDTKWFCAFCQSSNLLVCMHSILKTKWYSNTNLLHIICGLERQKSKQISWFFFSLYPLLYLYINVVLACWHRFTHSFTRFIAWIILFPHLLLHFTVEHFILGKQIKLLFPILYHHGSHI